MLSEGSGLSMGASSTKTRRLTIENVAQILQKAPSSRLPAEYETVLDYMVKNLEFFRRPNDHASAGRNARVALTREQQMRLCEAMQCKYYGKGEELTVYGTKGDRFYIILEGVIGVKIPLPKELQFESTFAVFQYVLKETESIRKYEDAASKACFHIVRLIGQEFLRKQAFRRVTDLIECLRRLEVADAEVYEEYPELNEAIIRDEVRAVSGFRATLLAQHKKQIRKEPLKPLVVKVQYM